MGRTPKPGLEYYPFDVDFFSDIKVRKLIKRQSSKAIAVYALLLCTIYKEGYYMRWDEELPFIISESTGYDEAYIRETIKCCLAIGLLSKELYDSDGILTSKGIQTRYEEINRLCKRKAKVTDYSLIPSEEIAISSEEMAINSEEIGISSEEKAINSEEMPQSKVKKSKEKKSLSQEAALARVREERKLIEDFLYSEPAAEQAAAIGMTVGRYRAAARTVLDEWEAAGTTHATDAQVRSHMINQIRRKSKSEPSIKSTPTAVERRAAADEKARKRAAADEAERRYRAECEATGLNGWQRYCAEKGLDPNTSAAEYAKSKSWAKADEKAALDEFKQRMTKTD